MIDSLVSAHGIAAVLVLMAIDALLPVGGELVMVLAGAVAAGAFGRAMAPGAGTYVVLSLAGVAGSLLGAWAGWLLGARAGRGAVERHARLLHLGHGRLERAERWFAHHGAWAVLLGRLTPLVRSFIAVPAGVFRQPLGRYTALSLVAAAIWCFGFAGLGWALGSAYGSVDRVTRVFEAALVAAVLVALAAWLVRRRARAATDP